MRRSIKIFFRVEEKKKQSETIVKLLKGSNCSDLVPLAGVEPARRISPMDFESIASANFTTAA